METYKGAESSKISQDQAGTVERKNISLKGHAIDGGVGGTRRFQNSGFAEGGHERRAHEMVEDFHASPLAASIHDDQPSPSRHSRLPSLRSLVESGDIQLESGSDHHQQRPTQNHGNPAPTLTSFPSSATPFLFQRGSALNRQASSSYSSPLHPRPYLSSHRTTLSDTTILLPSIGSLEPNIDPPTTRVRRTNNHSPSPSDLRSNPDLSVLRGTNLPYHTHEKASKSQLSGSFSTRGRPHHSFVLQPPPSMLNSSYGIVRPSPDPEPETQKRSSGSSIRQQSSAEQPESRNHYRSQSDAHPPPLRGRQTASRSSGRGSAPAEVIDPSSTYHVLHSEDNPIQSGPIGNSQEEWSSVMPESLPGNLRGSRLARTHNGWNPNLSDQFTSSSKRLSAKKQSPSLSSSSRSYTHPEPSAVLLLNQQADKAGSSSAHGRVARSTSNGSELSGEQDAGPSNPRASLSSAPASPNLNPPAAVGTSSSGNKVHRCDAPDCGKVFKRSEHLRRHIRSLHMNTRPYECQYLGCTKRFNRSDNLIQHQRLHDNPTSTIAQDFSNGVRGKRGPRNQRPSVPRVDKGVRYKWIEDPRDPSKLIQDYGPSKNPRIQSRQNSDSQHQGIGGIPSDRFQSIHEQQRKRAAAKILPPKPSFMEEDAKPKRHIVKSMRSVGSSSTFPDRIGKQEDAEGSSDAMLDRDEPNFLLPDDEYDEDEDIELDLDEELEERITRVDSRESIVEAPYYPSLPREGDEGQDGVKAANDRGDVDSSEDFNHNPPKGTNDPEGERDSSLRSSSPSAESAVDSSALVEGGEIKQVDADGFQILGKRKRVPTRKSVDSLESTKSSRSRASSRTSRG